MFHTDIVVKKVAVKNESKRLLILVTVGVVLILINYGIVQYYLLSLRSNPSTLFSTYQPVSIAYRPDPLNKPFPGAVPLRSGEITAGYISSSTDTDYYTFTIASKADVVLTATDLPKDYDCVLYAPDISFVVRSMNRGLQAETINMTLDPGQYYYRVYSKSGDFSNRPYTVKYTEIAL